MTPLLLTAFIALVAVTLYALLGGADFGGGVWDLFATGPRRAEQRGAIAHAIGPVWEANHVWLIFAIVLLFTCFPAAFAIFAIGLYAPLTLALVGIVLRGAAFVFRGYAHEASGTSFVWGRVFGVASVITPIFLGAAVGSVASGTFRWYSPFSLTIGFFALAVCAQVAATFLTLETDDAEIENDFRLRALRASGAVVLIGAAALAIARVNEPGVWASIFTRTALPGVLAAMAIGLIVVATLWVRAYAIARVVVGMEVVAILAGWYGAQAPWMIPGRMTYLEAAAPDVTLVSFLWTAAIGSVFFIPSLILLFVLFKGQNPAADDIAPSH